MGFKHGVSPCQLCVPDLYKLYNERPRQLVGIVLNCRLIGNRKRITGYLIALAFATLST